MTVDLAAVASRESGVYRTARRSGTVFAPPAWRYTDAENGTFGGRFDDPGLTEGLSEAERFRVIYCATEKFAAFAESLSAFRRSVRFLAELNTVQAEPEPVANSLAGTFDPADPTRGLITVEWRMQRQIGHAVLDPTLRFVDIADTASLNHLRQALASVADRLGLDDLDLSAITSRHRALTQACARYIYEQYDEHGRPLYGGIRYLSHLGGGTDDECWAIFSDRMRLVGEPTTAPIPPDDPALLDVARKLSLTIELFNGHYLRP